MRMPAATKEGGRCFATPDLCKTPPPPPGVPVPYPNIGDVCGASKTTTKVLIRKKKCVVLTSEIPNSKGDLPGVMKGVVSGTVASKVIFKKASSKVYAEKKKMVYHTAATAHNGSNANMPVGCVVAPSQNLVDIAI